MSLRVPNWRYVACVSSLLGCLGQTESDLWDEPEDRASDSTPVPSDWDAALSVEHIDGEGFHQVWGTRKRLWILGGPSAAAPAAGEAPAIQPCPSPNRLPVDNILRSSVGQGWQARTLPETPALTSLHGSSDSDVWMVGLDAAALSFDGVEWHRHDVRSADGLEFPEANDACAEISLHSVFARAPDDVWAVGYIFPSPRGPGLILHYDGEHWRRDAIDAPDGLFDVWASSPSNAWAVGSSGLVYHYDGERWLRTDAKTTDYLISVLGTAAGDVWATGNTAVTTRFDGTEWALVEAGKPYASRRALAGDASAGLWALETTSGPGSESRQALVRWDGSTWVEEAFTVRPAAQLGDLWLAPDGQLWGVGDAIVRLR